MLKYLDMWMCCAFSQLFGEPDADNDVSPDTELIPIDEYNNGMCVCVCVCVCVLIIRETDYNR